jgi:hypothetical protein
MSELPLGGSWAGGWDEPGVLSAVIVESGTPGTGVFVYSGVPGPGNLPIDWVSGTNVDPYGNVLPTAGIANRAGVLIASLFAGAARFFDTDFPPNNPALIQIAGAGAAFQQIQITSGNVSTDLPTSIFLGSGNPGQVQVTGGPLTSTAGTAANPTLITTDTWNNMTLLNSWTLGSGGYARYMMGNNGNVYVEGDNVIPGTTTGGTNVWTIPAAYIPGGQTQRVLMYVEVSTGAPVTDTPRFDATTGGQFQCFNVPGTTTRVGFNGQYSLT